MLQAGPARWKPGAQGASAFPPAASEHGVDITCNEHRGHGAHTKRATDTAAHPSSVSINPGPGGRPQQNMQENGIVLEAHLRDQLSVLQRGRWNDTEKRVMLDRKSTRLNSSHKHRSRMPSSA